MSTQAAPPSALTAVPTGTIARQEFGAQQLTRSAETAASAVAAQATAMIQARYVMALQRPRDLDEVRIKIMKEVERPGFAEAAWFRKPVGQGVEGLSIRFAEAAARCLGNISSDPMVVFEDDRQRIVRLLVTDLESNLTYAKDIVVTKTVERNSLRQGQVAMSVRQNSQGKTTYLVEATDDEVLAKENSLISKAFRNSIERILPGDIKDAAKLRIKAIRAGDVAKDPEGARKKIADAFAGIGVMPAQLKELLGHELASSSPTEIQELRDVYAAINNGEATWVEVMEARTGEAPEAPTPTKGMAGAKERLAETAKQPEPAKAEAAAVPTSTQAPDPEPERQPGEDEKPCSHSPLWRLAAGTPPGRTLVCPDCDLDVTPLQISNARQAQKEK